MKCPICQADNSSFAKTCQSCGSNLNTRGGADIVLRQDGTADHAGDSRWKAGAGTVGVGALAGLAKFGVLGLVFKLYWVYALVHLAAAGGVATIIGIAGIVALAAGTLFRFRKRLPI